MNFLERLGLGVMHRMDPEKAHGLAMKSLSMGLVPMPGGPITSGRLTTGLASLTLPNPIGLAAGFDKNGTVLDPLSRAGFGFLEMGAVTPRPQPGNPKPRLFRLKQDQAAINRFGFNNDGMGAALGQLQTRPNHIIIGLNLGANKDSDDRSRDFAQVLAHCGPHLDFATVNVSSPNTENLRDLQGAAALRALLDGVIETRSKLDRPIPIFLKIAPDLTDDELGEIAEVAMAAEINAIIATNTTLDRSGLHSADADQAGGLSGAPLFEKSTRVLALLSRLTDGQMPLVGVGGIASAEDAYAKICAGATAVQLYTALIYHGMSLVPQIARGLDALLERDGFANVTHAVGSRRDEWL